MALTKNIAKPLLKVKGRPIIDYLMEKILELDEINEILISISRRFEKQFRNWLRTRNYRNTRFIIERSLSEEEKLGAVAAIAKIIPELGREDCLRVAGDNLFTFSLRGFLDFFSEKKSPVIGIYDIKDLDLARNYAVVKLDENFRVISLVEKPGKPDSGLIATCIYAMPFKHLALVDAYLREGGNRDAPGYFIEWLCSKTRVYGYLFRGRWYDIGNMKSYEEAKKNWR